MKNWRLTEILTLCSQIDDLAISKDVPIWEVNIIRSFVSQLQIDTQGKNLISSKLNSVPKNDEDNGVYKTMEDTVDGECEVLYDITPLPKYTLQRDPQLAPQPQLAEQGKMIDIVKTKNFDNCKHRPGYHFGLTGITGWEPTSNDMGNFLSRSSVSRVILSGNLKSYTIQSSVTINKVILSPELYNEQKGEVVSRVNVTLSKVHSASSEIQEPSNLQSVHKLVYDFNTPSTNDHEARDKLNQRKQESSSSSSSSSSSEEAQKEKHTRNRRPIEQEQQQAHLKNQANKKHGQSSSSSSSSSSSESSSVSSEEWQQQMPTMEQAPENPLLPYFIGYKGHSVQDSKEINVNQVVRKTAEQIGQQLQNPNQIPKQNTLERFTILTRVISTMNVKQLEQATQELYSKKDQGTEASAAWKAYRDAVAQAGTGPSLMVIKSWIQKKQIQGEEAAQIISTLAESAKTPTAEYIRTLFVSNHPESK